jgi:hypothetical protein
MSSLEHLHHSYLGTTCSSNATLLSTTNISSPSSSLHPAVVFFRLGDQAQWLTALDRRYPSCNPEFLPNATEPSTVPEFLPIPTEPSIDHAFRYLEL